jgi:hypothetical protein
MSRTLRAKIEDAITAYLKANPTPIGILAAQVFPASSTAEPTGDWLRVEMGPLDPDPDLPQVKRGKLKLTYRTAATKDGSERSTAETSLEKLDTFMLKPVNDDATWSDGNREAGVLLAALNKPLSGADSRTVTPLHIYYLGPSEEANDVEEEGWIDQLVYDVIAQPMNSH